jgi:hypothetical protein
MLVQTRTGQTLARAAAVIRVLLLLVGGVVVSAQPSKDSHQRTIFARAAANFPYLIDPYSAIQNYVHNKSPNTTIQAVLDDFDYGAVNETVIQADACFVFANADSGEGYVHISLLATNIQTDRLIRHCFRYVTVDTNAGDRNV